MAPSLNFNPADFPPLPTKPPTRVTSSPRGMPSYPTWQPEVAGTAPSLLCTYVGQPAVTYGRLHLLGLPGEVRLAIWRAIHSDVLLGSQELWFNRPLTAWDGLQITCRQIRSEIADFWPCTIIPQAKVEKAFTQVLSIELLTNFRRLSLELPFNKGRDFYESLASALGGLAPVLEDLRLFFVGEDKFKVKSFVHGCGSRDPGCETSSMKLAVEGQYKHELQPVFFAMYFLQRLRTLVINNANYPLLQSMIIKHKPQLEYLHISTDPRSCLHTLHDLEGKQQLILPPKDAYPPIKVLHISANAVLIALHVAAKVSRTLEELNWTVPDVAHQFFQYPWLAQTTVLLEHFGRHSRKLRTLRICLHAPLYECHHSEGTLIGGLKEHLPSLIFLETLELHIHSKADFSGQEIIFAIPDSVKRLYISDKLISPQKLDDLITKRYLRSNAKVPQKSDIEGWAVKIININDGWGQSSTQLPSPQTTDFSPSSFRNYHGPTKGYYTERNGKAVYVRSHADDEMIGEARGRIDHIPFRHGKLGFIGYEYDGHSKFCECGKCDETKLIMLRLNGRLLDRERNNHLTRFDGGLQILPKSHAFIGTMAPRDDEIIPLDAVDVEITRKITLLEKDSIPTAEEDEKQDLQKAKTREPDRQDIEGSEEESSKKFAIQQIEICVTEFTTEQLQCMELQQFDRIMNSLDAHKDNKHSGYFGTEKAAVEHFEKEMTVMEWELLERRWPEETMVGVKEHWLSEA